MECSWSENFSTNDRKKAVRMLMEGREFATQLQLLLVQNQKPLGDHGAVDADVFVTKILGSFGSVLALLNSGESTGDVCQSAVTSSPFSDEGKSVGSDHKRKTPALLDRRGAYKRRKGSNSWIQITPKPIEDCYGWRKYGQKEILDAKHPRNYFRCTHKSQGCLATKQVQKTDDEPSMYQTTYLGHHTCTDPLKSLQLIPNSNNVFDFKSNLTFPTFPSIKFEPEIPSTENQPSSSDQYIYASDLNAFELLGPATMLASSSGSDHGDVISSVYSCTTSSESLDLDLMLGTVDFNDDFLHAVLLESLI